MEDQAKELVQFLSHTRVDVRRSAVDAILGMTGSDEARELLRGTPVVKKLAGLIGDIDFVAKPAVSALINLCGSRAMLDDIVAAGIAGRVMENLVERRDKFADLQVMLLANLSVAEEGAEQVLQLREADGALRGLHLRRLLSWFNKGDAEAAAGSDVADPFEHAASIFVNTTQLTAGRELFLRSETRLYGSLLPHLESSSTVRRRGIARTLKNLAFDREAHELLIGEPDVSLALLRRMAGPDGVGDAAEADPEQRREEDAGTRTALLETLVLLCTSRVCREHVRAIGGYEVVRDMHSALKEDIGEVEEELVLDVVNFLMRDEEGTEGAATAVEQAAERHMLGIPPSFGARGAKEPASEAEVNASAGAAPDMGGLD